MQEIRRMGVGIMSLSETWWKEEKEYNLKLPDSVGGINTKCSFQEESGVERGWA